MLQIGRNLSDAESGALRGKRYLIIDRDTKYTDQFRRSVRESGTEVIRLPPMSPNLNAYAERFVRSIKEECLNRMIFIGQASLRRAVAEFMEHYHEERNHQGLGNRLIRSTRALPLMTGWCVGGGDSGECSTSTTEKPHEQHRPSFWIVRHAPAIDHSVERRRQTSFVRCCG